MSEELDKEAFLKGVDEGATKFYNGLLQNLHETGGVIGNDKIGKEALADIINLQTMSVKLDSAMRFLAEDEKKEIYIHGRGFIVGVDLYGQSLEALLEEHGHICWEVLKKTWPFTQLHIKAHVLEVMNSSDTIH